MFHPIFCLRRLIYAFSIILFINYLAFQIMIMLFLSTLMLSYIVLFRPFHNPLLNFLEIVNEITLILCLECAAVFTDFVEDPYAKYYTGYAIIGIVGIDILINIIAMVKVGAQAIVVKVRKCRQNKKEKRTKKYSDTNLNSTSSALNLNETSQLQKREIRERDIVEEYLDDHQPPQDQKKHAQTIDWKSLLKHTNYKGNLDI